MKTTTLAWMADKNHATIIHACKTIEQFLEIREPMTMQLMEEWIKVFNGLFSSASGKRAYFNEGLNELIQLSCMPIEEVKNLLISKLQYLEMMGDNDVSLNK